MKDFTEAQVKPQNMEYLGKLIDFCAENNIEFVAVTTPIPIDTLKVYSDNFNAASKYLPTLWNTLLQHFHSYDHYSPYNCLSREKMP